MKKLFKFIIVLTSIALSLGCSQQYRTSKANISDSEVYELLDEVVGAKGLNGMSVDNLNSNFTTYYVAQSGADKMGDVFSVLSFGFMDFLGYSGMTIVDVDPLEASALFLDATNENGERSFHLYFKMLHENGSTEIKSFHPTNAAHHFSFENNMLEAYLSGEGADLIVYTYDLDNNFSEELAGTIQLKVDEIVNGERYHIGKISVLAGFGGFR